MQLNICPLFSRNSRTGLGLYIVQSLCVAHGWVVSVTDAPAGGSIFEITIPTT